MQKIVSFAVDDIVVDPEGVTTTLNAACNHRSEARRVRAVCQVGETVFFVLSPLFPQESHAEYRLVTVEDTTWDGFSALLEERWTGGFDPVGAIKLYETTMVLFGRSLDA